MFDDQNTPTPGVQPAQSTPASAQPEDIFAKTDAPAEGDAPAVSEAPDNLPIGGSAPMQPSVEPVAPSPAPIQQPVQQTAPVAPVEPSGKTLPPMPKSQGGAGKVILIIVGIFIVLGVAGGLTYFFIMQSPQDAGNGTVLDSEIIDEEVEDVKDVEEKLPVDSDGDGLTDDEESKFGTDPLSPDSDKDGLGDKEEVKTYGTDPLDPDTDGDSFLDGQEVVSGFNPNGSGKLYDIPK